MISLHISQNKYTKPSFLQRERRRVDGFNGLSDMGDHFYKQTNDSVDIDTLRQEYAKKTEMLPLIMDRVMASVGKYIAGEKGSNEFSKNFLDGASSLANRIAVGDDSKEYCKNYKPEISMIKGLTPVCDEYLNEKIETTQLDSAVEEKVIEYVNDGTKRTKHFIR